MRVYSENFIAADILNLKDSYFNSMKVIKEENNQLNTRNTTYKKLSMEEKREHSRSLDRNTLYNNLYNNNLNKSQSSDDSDDSIKHSEDAIVNKINLGII
jgi:hypothetical protein